MRAQLRRRKVRCKFVVANRAEIRERRRNFGLEFVPLMQSDRNLAALLERLHPSCASASQAQSNTRAPQIEVRGVVINAVELARYATRCVFKQRMTAQPRNMPRVDLQLEFGFEGHGANRSRSR